MYRPTWTSPSNPSRLLKTTPNIVVSRVPSSHTLTAYAPGVPLPAALLEAVLSSLRFRSEQDF